MRGGDSHRGLLELKGVPLIRRRRTESDGRAKRCAEEVG
jgi:hypothetical protein